MKTRLVVAACVAFLVGCSPAGSGSGQTSSPVRSAASSVASSTSPTSSTSPRPSAYTVDGEGGPSSPSPKPGVVDSDTSLYDAIDAIPGFEAASENQDKQCVTAKATLPLVHADPSAGTFTQRFIFCLSGAYKQNLIQFTGAGDGLAVDESDGMANTLSVGRRFWSRLPAGARWEQLTHKAVAQDVELIRSQLVDGLRLTGPWVGYGAYLGGTDALWHTMYHPQTLAAVWADSPIIAPDPQDAAALAKRWSGDPDAGGGRCFVQLREVQREMLQRRERYEGLVRELLRPAVREQWVSPEAAYEGWVLGLPSLWAESLDPSDCSGLPEPTSSPDDLVRALGEIPGALDTWYPGDAYHMAASGAYLLRTFSAPEVLALVRTPMANLIQLPPSARRPAVDALGEDSDLRSWLSSRAENVILTFDPWETLWTTAPAPDSDRQLLVVEIPRVEDDAPSPELEELTEQWFRWLDNLD